MMKLPFNYILDESDPDIVLLRRQGWLLRGRLQR